MLINLLDIALIVFGLISNAETAEIRGIRP